MKKRMYKIMGTCHDSSYGGTDGSADNCICS